MNKRQTRRSRRRRSRFEDRKIQQAAQHVQPLFNKLPLTKVLSEEGVIKIHQASMRLLKEIGLLIVDFPPARETFRTHGAQVEGELVRIDEDALMHFVNQAPFTFTQLARNPSNNLPIGGRHIVFAPVYGPPIRRRPGPWAATGNPR